MSDSHHTSVDADSPEQQADAAADLKVVLLVFTTAVIFAVLYVSGWSPQF